MGSVRVADTFTSLQGEGALSGTPMHFIRFAGCSVTGCGMHPKWGGACDTDLSGGRAAPVDELVLAAGLHNNRWVCVTGGEPCDQPKALVELVTALHGAGLLVNLQTSGTQRVPVDVDFLSVSPKSLASVATDWCHELKYVYRGQPPSEMAAMRKRLAAKHYFLMPFERGGEFNFQRTAAAVAILGDPWAMTVQMHKWAGLK